MPLRTSFTWLAYVLSLIFVVVILASINPSLGINGAATGAFLVAGRLFLFGIIFGALEAAFSVPRIGIVPAVKASLIHNVFWWTVWNECSAVSRSGYIFYGVKLAIQICIAGTFQ